jgi:hypothetical protein
MMDFFSIFSDISSYLQNNIWIAIAIAALLIFLFYNRPRIFIVVLVFGLILAGVMYLISDLASSGTAHKSNLIRKGMMPP